MKKVFLAFFGFFLSFFVLIGNVDAKEQSIVLMYHRIGDVENDMNTTPQLFAEQMKYLHDHKFNIISAKDLVQAIKDRKPLPDKSIVISFDDGWKTQKNAMSVLNKYNYPAMFALVTEYQTYKNNTYLSKEDINEASDKNFIFVNHSHTHFMKDFLLNPDQDVKISKAQIIQSTGKFVPIYVYPYGKRNKNLLSALVKNGYEAGFGVYGHPVDVKTANIFNINRYLLNDKTTMDDFIKIVEQAV